MKVPYREAAPFRAVSFTPLRESVAALLAPAYRQEGRASSRLARDRRESGRRSCSLETEFLAGILTLFTEKQWCRRGDLNPHRDYSPLDPESSASANSATSALLSKNLKSQIFSNQGSFHFTVKYPFGQRFGQHLQN